MLLFFAPVQPRGPTVPLMKHSSINGRKMRAHQDVARGPPLGSLCELSSYQHPSGLGVARPCLHQRGCRLPVTNQISGCQWVPQSEHATQNGNWRLCDVRKLRKLMVGQNALQWWPGRKVIRQYTGASTSPSRPNSAR